MKLIGLLVTLLAIGLLFYMAYGRKEPELAGASPADSALGAAPPTDVASNAKSALHFSESQTCLANCASVFRTCAAIAMDAPATEACTQEKAACEHSCH